MGDERRIKLWHVLASDDSEHRMGEYVVAAGTKAEARAAFLAHGLRGWEAPTTARLDVAPAFDRGGAVFRLDHDTGRWLAL